MTTAVSDRKTLHSTAEQHGWRVLPYSSARDEYRRGNYVLTVWYRSDETLSTNRPPDLSRFGEDGVLRTATKPVPGANDSLTWALGVLAMLPSPRDLQSELQQLWLDQIHPLHQQLYKLREEVRPDPAVSRALNASLSVVCSAVSALSEALQAAAVLAEK